MGKTVEEEVVNEELTNQQILFCKKYLINGFNGAEAARQASYSEKCAKEIAHRLLTNVHIRAYIQKYLKEVLDTLDDTLDTRIIKTYAVRAFYNPSDIIDEDGKLRKKLKEMGGDAIIIDGIENDLKVDKRGNEHKNIKIKLANRNEALKQLTAYRKLITKTIEIVEKTPISDISDGDEQKAKNAYKQAIIQKETNE